MINKYIKSPLNYIGGKYKLLPQIIPLFPKSTDIFVDLFSGGANVGINANAKQVVFNDINFKINGLFKWLQHKNPQAVLKQIYSIIDHYHLSKTNRKGFLKLRKYYNNQAKPSPLLLYVLASYSYNYQIRFNQHLKFNNPFGKNRSQFTKNMKAHLIQFMTKLNQINAVFTSQYFTKLDFNKLTTDSFVYADPPYLITDGSYNDGKRAFGNWTIKQEHQLYKLLDHLNKRHIKFALSEVIQHKGKINHILLHWLHQHEYQVHDLQYTYKNASYNTKHLSSKEVLITNY